MKFASRSVVASSQPLASDSMRLWDLGTGRETSVAVPQGFTLNMARLCGYAPLEHTVNGYLVAAKGDVLCVFKADGSEHGMAGSPADNADGAGAAEPAPVGFFQGSSAISAIDVSNLEGTNIAVGCADGQVLQLWTAVLQTPG